MKPSLILGIAIAILLVAGVAYFLSTRGVSTVASVRPLSEAQCAKARKAAGMREWQPVPGCPIRLSNL